MKKLLPLIAAEYTAFTKTRTVRMLVILSQQMKREEKLHKPFPNIIVNGTNTHLTTVSLTVQTSLSLQQQS